MYIWVIIFGAIAYLVSALLIPIIIKKAHEHQWLDIPVGRKKHTTPVPALGGIGIFMGCWVGLFGYSLIFGIELELAVTFMLTLILCVVGIKDDLSDLSAKLKLAIQLAIAVVLYLLGICKLDGFYGILGITEVPEFINFLTSIFSVALIVNAYNLIDGINGLAGSLGFMSAVLFGLFFYSAGAENWAFFAFCLAGGILGFLRYNFGRASIFMGDNGSTFVGLVLAILFFQLVKLNGTQTNTLPMALSIISVPVVDLIRVFSTRILKGRSPVIGDRTHIHYIMMKRLVLPERVCYLLIGFNLLLFGLIWAFSSTIPVTQGILITLGSVWLLASVSEAIDNVEFSPGQPNKEQVNEI